MKLTHPNAPKSSVEASDEHAEAYISQGWVEVAEKAPAKPAPKPDSGE